MDIDRYVKGVKDDPRILYVSLQQETLDGITHGPWHMSPPYAVNLSHTSNSTLYRFPLHIYETATYSVGYRHACFHRLCLLPSSRLIIPLNNVIRITTDSVQRCTPISATLPLNIVIRITADSVQRCTPISATLPLNIVIRITADSVQRCTLI